MLFAHLKRILKLDRRQSRVPCRARMSFISQPSPKTAGNWQGLQPNGTRARTAASVTMLRGQDIGFTADFFNTIDPKRTLVRPARIHAMIFAEVRHARLLLRD